MHKVQAVAGLGIPATIPTTTAAGDIHFVPLPRANMGEPLTFFPLLDATCPFNRITVWRTTMEEEAEYHNAGEWLAGHMHIPGIVRSPQPATRLRLVFLHLQASGLYMLRSRRTSTVSAQFPNPQVRLNGEAAQAACSQRNPR